MLDTIAKLTYWAVQALSWRGPRRNDRRGIALVLVMATVAILSISVIEFAYQTNVNAFLAANARDELKAYYLAKSGMNLATLMLGFQYELERDPVVGRFMQNSNFQLYPLIGLFLTPFATGKLDTPVGGLDLGDGATGFGGFQGTFDVEIEPEEGKLNLNALASRTGNQDGLTWMCQLLGDQQKAELFNSEIGAANEEDDKVRRQDLVANIIDWVDPNEQRTTMNEFCVVEGQGSGDEDGSYARRDTPYRVKNAKFTTIEEVRLVHGMTDEVFDNFKDTFTVYPVDKVNLNLANVQVLQSLLCSHVAGADATNWPCRDPNVLVQVSYLALGLDGIKEFFSNPLNLLFYYMNSQNAPNVIDGASKGQTVAYRNTRQLIRYLNALKSNPILLQQFISYSPTAYQALGPLAQTVATTAPPLLIEFNERDLLRDVTTSSPRIFKVVARGSYGDSTKTLVSVVDFSRKTGRTFYWREY
jgi:type II secretory pathway component PulK